MRTLKTSIVLRALLAVSGSGLLLGLMVPAAAGADATAPGAASAAASGPAGTVDASGPRELIDSAAKAMLKDLDASSCGVPQGSGQGEPPGGPGAAAPL